MSSPIHARWHLIKNASANLARGGATAVMVLLLPPVLVRHMPASEYAVWILVLQTAGYISYIDLGLQTAVGRFVAFANEKRDAGLRDSVFSTAVAGLSLAGFASTLLLILSALAIHILFPSIPLPLAGQMRWALLIVGASYAIGLPASAWGSAFAGLQRYEIPAITVGLTRILGSLGLICAAMAHKSMLVLACVMATSNLVCYMAQYQWLRRIAPEIQFRFEHVSKQTAHDLYDYCVGLTLMAASNVLVNGVDLIVVGRFDFASVTPYSAATGAITFVSGLLYAVLTVILPHATTLHARQNLRELGRLSVIGVRISMTLLLLVGTPLITFAAAIIRLWIGSKFVLAGRPFLEILVVANILRLSLVPYTIVLVAAMQQRYTTISLVLEGITNLTASLILGKSFGGLGVALGTLIGAFVGVAVHFFYSMPNTRMTVAFTRPELLASSFTIPIACLSPTIAVTAWSLAGKPIRWEIFLLFWLISALAATVSLTRSRGEIRSIRDQESLSNV